MDRWRLSYLGALIVPLGISGGCAAVPSCAPAEPLQASASQAAPPTPSAPARLVANQALEHKVKAQEKRIAELSAQLKMLKHIDLDRSKP